MCRIQGCHGTARRNADYCMFHIGLAMDCPKCGVERGNWCKNKGGGRANAFHVIRTERGQSNIQPAKNVGVKCSDTWSANADTLRKTMTMGLVGAGTVPALASSRR